VSQAFLDAVAKLAVALGAEVVAPDAIRAGDITLEWEGRTVGGFRPAPAHGLHGALERMMADVERELGTPLRSLGREDRQAAVRMLEERGAFTLRRSVEEIADALGVSRFTVYNYLDRDGTSLDEG
jgi:HTH domain